MSTPSSTVLGFKTNQEMKFLRKTGSCMVHAGHRPEPLVCVFHHIIPREWQYKWQPNRGTHQLLHEKRVWAPDCVQVCPTGHANIHEHINAIMDRLSIQRGVYSEINIINNYPKYHNGNRREIKVAQHAFFGWADSGGPWDIIVPPRVARTTPQRVD